MLSILQIHIHVYVLNINYYEINKLMKNVVVLSKFVYLKSAKLDTLNAV